MSAARRVAQILRLMLADLRRDWALSICQIFALAAVLTPLLVLFGLQQGILGDLLRNLQQNPAMLEINPRVTGTNRFDLAWLAAARSRPDVAFVAGDVLLLAAEVEVTPAAELDGPPTTAVLVPTREGDPLAPEASHGWAAGHDQVVLSFGVARALHLGSGDRMEILVPRVRAGVDEAQHLTVTVAAVLPPERMAETRHVVLVSEALLLNVQSYRDGYAVPDLGWDGATPPAGPPHFERFRLYARTIDDVAPLASWLREQGIEPVSRLEDIAPIQALNQSLTTILAVISAFAAAGFIVALAATQWSSVERKRRELALLTLIGYGRLWLVALPLLQALVLALLGSLVAVALFLGAATVINLHFPAVSTAASACLLTLGQLAIATGTMCGLAVAAAILAAVEVTRIEPAAVIRNV